MPKIVSILAQRQIFLLWIGRLLSAFGDRFFDIAIVWISVQLIGSEAGFILAAGSIANLLGGLVGGVIADRWDRRKLMIGIDIIRALSILSLPIAAYFSEITLIHLAIAAAIEGVMGSLFDPALQASLPQLVQNEQDLQAGNALLDISMRVSQIFAPGLAGLLIALIPTEHLFTIDAVTFVISGVALFAIGRNFQWQPVPSAEGATQGTGLKGALKEIQGAFKLVYEYKPMLWGIISYIPFNIAWAGSLMVGLALLADGPLEVGAQGYGLLFTIYGIGGVLSNVVVGSMNVKRKEWVLFGGQAIFGFGIILVAMSNTFWIAGAAVFLASLGMSADLMLLFMAQNEFPSNQVGKIFSLRFAISSGGYSAGLLIAAYLFQWFDIRLGLILLGGLCLITGLIALFRFRSHTHFD